jgi:ribose 5-phosphate isomerase RpiB
MSIVDAYLGAKVQGGRHERRRKQINEMEPRPMTTADGAARTRRIV